MARYSSVFYGGSSSDAMVFWNAGVAGTGFFFMKFPEGVYFDSIRLENPEPFWEDRSPVVNVTRLLSEEQSVQCRAIPEEIEPPLKVTFRCQTTIHGNISLLLAKIGRPYTLEIDEFTYEKCYISSFREYEWYPEEFEYVVTFVQDTTT